MSDHSGRCGGHGRLPGLLLSDEHHSPVPRGNWYYNITLEPKQPGLGTIPVYNQVVSCYTTALTDSKFTAICELVKELGITWVVTRKLGEQKSI